MSAFNEERVLSVHHWTDRLFTFTTTRDPALRFSNGHFTMIGLRVNDKPLLRAYSIVSANYEEHLEFLSIKVPDGPLTSRLQHIQVGRHDHRRPQAHRHAGDRLPAAGQAAVPAVHRHRPGAVHEHHARPGHLREVRAVILVHGVRQVTSWRTTTC